MSATVVAMVDGEELANENIEIAAFNGDVLMSNGETPQVMYGHYVYMMTLNGYNTAENDQSNQPYFNGNRLHFKMYDHSTNQELEYNSSFTITYLTNAIYGDLANPMPINFFSGETVWERVNDASELNAGDMVILTGNVNDIALNNVQNTSNRGAALITRTGNTITWEEGSIFGEPQPITLYKTSMSGDDEYSFFVSNGFLAATSSTADVLSTIGAVKAGSNYNYNANWAISTNDEGVATVMAQGDNTRNTLQAYKANAFDDTYAEEPADAVSLIRFSCYAGETKDKINIYRQVLYVAPDSFQVTITVDPQGAGTVTGAGSYEDGAEVTVNATANEGYDFTAWMIGEEVVSEEAEYTFTIQANVNLTAAFTLKSYEITVTADPEEGGTVTGADTYNHGEEVTVAATANTGYSFVNWTIGEETVSEEAEYTFTATADCALVAHFELEMYEVTMAMVDGGAAWIEEEGPTYAYGTVLHFGNAPIDGWNFVRYEVDGEEVTSPYTVTGPAVITPVFEQVPYTVTVVVNPAEGGTYEISQEAPYHFFDEITVTAIPNDDYEFTGWMIGEELLSEDAEFSFMILGNVALTANFALKTFTVTVAADPEEGGTVTGGGTFDVNTEVTVEATAAEGYNFLNWKDGEEVVSTVPAYTFTLTEDIDLVAQFVEATVNVYAITVAADPEEGGIVTGGGNFIEGEDVTITATANEGYTFVNWTKDDEVVAETATYSFEATEDADYVAVFELNTYTVTVTANEGGTVTGDGTYNHGEEVTLTATPDLGYEFVHFIIDEEEITDNPYSFEIFADVEVEAVFALLPNEYTVTVTANPAAGGTVTGGGTFVEDTEVTVTATVNDGYQFVNWTVDEEEVATTLSYTFTLTEDIDLVANYIQVFEVTFGVNLEEGGTVDMESGIFPVGTEITVNATAADNFAFEKWTVNGEDVEGDEPTYTFTVTEATEVIANFYQLIVEYNIYIAEIENGAISAPEKAQAEEIVTVTVTPDPMYVLSALYYYTEDPEEVTAIDLETLSFEMPESDVTIGAEFTMMDFEKGDVNLDGEVNILDVLATLNYILEKDPQPFDFDQADMNDDGDIDISDAMAINAMILGLKGECEEGEAVYEIIDGKLYIDATMALSGYQFRLTAEPTVLDMPGFTTIGNWSNGEYIFCVYNLSGVEKAAGVYAILDLGNSEVSSVKMSTKEGCLVRGTEGTVSVSSFDEAQYTVFPVPAIDNVKVAGPGLNQVEVFNTIGQCVMVVNNINADETTVNVSSLNAGSYLFRISTANGTVAKSVIVVR